MDIFSIKSIHFCCLGPWVEIDSWKAHFNPQYMLEGTRESIIRYLTLRSSLIPYIYTAAHNANKTGIPMNRPLHLMYEDEGFDEVLNAYMLGEYFFVGAFDMKIRLPKGEWYDYFTGRKYKGGEEFTYEPPKEWSGALFVKAGAIIPKMKPQRYILEKPHDYEIEVFLGNDAEATLYEDDGFTFDYEIGKFAETPLSLKKADGGYTLTVGKREGSFEGRPRNGHNIFVNSIPKIDGIPEIKDMKIRILDEGIKSIVLDSESVEFERACNFVEFIMPKELHEAGELCYKIIL
jgi:alpha-glucosidase (family GH31 glycosyl hydrolase)